MSEFGAVRTGVTSALGLKARGSVQPAHASESCLRGSVFSLPVVKEHVLVGIVHLSVHMVMLMKSEYIMLYESNNKKQIKTLLPVILKNEPDLPHSLGCYVSVWFRDISSLT